MGNNAILSLPLLTWLNDAMRASNRFRLSNLIKLIVGAGSRARTSINTFILPAYLSAFTPFQQHRFNQRIRPETRDIRPSPSTIQSPVTIFHLLMTTRRSQELVLRRFHDTTETYEFLMDLPSVHFANIMDLSTVELANLQADKHICTVC